MSTSTECDGCGKEISSIHRECSDCGRPISCKADESENLVEDIVDAGFGLITTGAMTLPFLLL